MLSLLMVCCTLRTQAAEWSVSPQDYEFSMNIIGQIVSDSIIATGETLVIGAFVNDQCVGTTSPVDINEQYHTFFLTVYSNMNSGDTISYKYMDADGTMVVLSNITIFQTETMLGSVEQPYIWVTHDASDPASILSYTIAGEDIPAIINPITQTIQLITSETVLDNMVAQFVLSPGAVAYVNDVEQISGQTYNDYSSAIEYKLVAAGGSIAYWNVIVGISTAIATNRCVLFDLYPNPAHNTVTIDAPVGKMIQLFTLSGKMLLSTPITEVNQQVNISSLRPGVYLVKVQNYVARLVVE